MSIELFEGYSNELLQFAAIACIIFIVLGVPGNILTILALCHNKKKHNSTAIFIVHLSLADLLFGCFNLPLAATTFLKRSWCFSDLLCRLFPLLRYALLAVSLFMISLITINRYIIIVHPRFYARIYQRRNLYVMILSTWLLSFAIMYPTWRGIWGKFGLDINIGSCSILPDSNNNSPKEFLFAIAFILPCLCIIFCYTNIYRVVRRATLRIRESSPSNLVAPSSMSLRYFDVAPRMKLHLSHTVLMNINKISKLSDNLSAFTVHENFQYIDDNCSVDNLPITILSSSLTTTTTNTSTKITTTTTTTTTSTLLNDDQKAALTKLTNNIQNNNKNYKNQRNNRTSSKNMKQKSMGPSTKSRSKSVQRLNSRRNYSSIRHNLSNASSFIYPGRMTQKDRHLLIMILIIFVTFVICYLPITITKILKRTQQNYFINISSYLLIYVTTCINPIVYVVISTEYRQAYWELLKCWYGKWHQNKSNRTNDI